MGPSPVKEAFAGRPAKLRVKWHFCPTENEFQPFYSPSVKSKN